MDEQLQDIGLAVGAGGPTGGPFIDAALDVIVDRTGWLPGSAKRIVGTSAGAFVAARTKPLSETDIRDDEHSKVAKSLASLGNLEEFSATAGTRLVRELRLLGGRAVALLAPSERDQALYDVPEPPYHPGASVVAVEHTWGTRHEYNLADNLNDAASMIRASAAIPFKNGPIEIAGRKHIDGAVHSANNVDLLDPEQCPLVVVISPMIPASGGSLVSKFHRSQLIEELRPWKTAGRDAIVIMPSEDEHANRRDRDFFREAGTRAAERLFV